MLLKLVSTTVVANADSTLNLILLKNDGTTAIDTTNIASIQNVTNWFLLKGYNGTDFTSALTISAVAAGATPASGQVIITFSNTGTLVAAGDILVLAPGSLTPNSGDFNVILNTASINVGFDDTTPTDTLTEVSLVPKAYNTMNKNYNFKLDIITKQGDTISTITTTTNDPITVNGIVVTKILFNVTDGDTIYTSLEKCNYTVEFFDTDDNPVEYAPSASDIVSISFVPV